MSRKHCNTVFLFILACLLSACGRHSVSAEKWPSVNDSLCTAERAMLLYATEPQHALLLVDTVEAIGKEPSFTCDYIRATIYSRSTLQAYDTAIAICTTLLHHDSLTKDLPECAARRSNTLSLLCYSYRMLRDNEMWLRYSTELVELCRSTGDEVEALRTEAEIGFILTQIGRRDEGMALLNKAIVALDEPGSVNKMDAFIIAVKRKLNAMEEIRQQDGEVTLARRMLSRTAHFRQHASGYADDSYRLPMASGRLESYCDFCDAQSYGFIVKGFAAEGRLDSARYWLKVYEQTPYGRSYGGRRMIMPALIALGRYDEVLTICDAEEQRMRTDTFTAGYASLLRFRAMVAEGQHKPQAASELWRRYAYLDHALSDSLQASTAHTYAARFHAQEQQRLIEQKEATLRADRIYMTAGAIVCLLIIAFALWQVHQKRLLDAKNRVLAQQISEMLQIKAKRKEAEDEQTAVARKKLNTDDLKQLSDKQLFKHLSYDIRTNHLYCNPMCDRNLLTSRYGLSAAQLGAAFARGSAYDSLSDFIRECRLEYACALLTESDKQIGEVAREAGFSRATTFNHDFKARYSLSPSEYRRQSRGV